MPLQQPEILLVEDEVAVRSVIGRHLARAGYSTVSACDGTSALVALAAHQASVCLLIVDLLLPDISGRQFVQDAFQWFGPRPVLYISAAFLPDIPRANQYNHRSMFLAKPFTTEMLLERVRMLLDGADVGTFAVA
jgi:two-component system cell cycle sensor histidine kinase/response regulator CckA